MKFIRYAKGSTQYRGILDGNIIKRINGTIFHDYSLAAETINLSDVQILPPVLPSKIIGFRKNYNGKKEEMGQPKIFMKPQSSIIAHNENIILPKNEKSVRIEGELALIIGKKAKNVEECHASEHIFGYTIANDITAPQNEQDLTVTKGKCYDTFTPLGPCMVTDIDVSNIMINILQQRKEYDECFGIFEKKLIFALVSIVIAYPKLFINISIYPYFRDWDKSLLDACNIQAVNPESLQQLKLIKGLDLEDLKEHAPWELALFRMCQFDDGSIDLNAFEKVLKLLKLVDKMFLEEVNGDFNKYRKLIVKFFKIVNGYPVSDIDL